MSQSESKILPAIFLFPFTLQKDEQKKERKKYQDKYRQPTVMYVPTKIHVGGINFQVFRKHRKIRDDFNIYVLRCGFHFMFCMKLVSNLIVVLTTVRKFKFKQLENREFQRDRASTFVNKATEMFLLILFCKQHTCYLLLTYMYFPETFVFLKGLL